MRNFNISALRGRASLTSRCSGGIKGFSCLIKASIVDKILLKFRLLSTLRMPVLEKVVYPGISFGRISSFASFLSLWLSSFLEFPPEPNLL